MKNGSRSTRAFTRVPRVPCPLRRRNAPLAPVVLGALGVLLVLAAAAGLWFASAPRAHAAQGQIAEAHRPGRLAKTAKTAKTGRILVLRLEGPISPVSAEALGAAVDRAEREDYKALVIELDTPGGLESSMRAMIKRMLVSEVPIIAYVSPAGARAQPRPGCSSSWRPTWRGWRRARTSARPRP